MREFPEISSRLLQKETFQGLFVFEGRGICFLGEIDKILVEQENFPQEVAWFVVNENFQGFEFWEFQHNYFVLHAVHVATKQAPQTKWPSKFLHIFLENNIILLEIRQISFGLDRRI